MAEKNVILKDTMGNTLYPEIADNSVTKVKLSNGVLDDVTPITWYELKQLRNWDNLTPGHQYRIIDYLCTTTQDNTLSTNHQFDIIVTADNTNKLNEKARACLHDGDTYFKDSNLAAWQLWYSLDNDTKRFAWADDNSGKGVIYRMIDEWNNDCPYDFKNIQFKRYKITKSKSSSLVGTYLATKTISGIGLEIDNNDSKMFYTFSYLGELDTQSAYTGEVLEDASIIGNTLQSNYSNPYGVHSNTIKYYFDVDIENLKPILSLNNIVFLTYSSDYGYYGCYSNSFGINCSNISFGGDKCYNNLFGINCSNISFGDTYYNNLFGINCYNISFGDICFGNSFGNYCYDISFGDVCLDNSFGNYCYNISFNDECSNISLGNDCTDSSLGTGCTNISFGTECNHITLGNYYRLNTFDHGVSYITFNGDGYESINVQNYHIKQGMEFDRGSEYTITAKPGLNYELSVAKRSDGTVVEYNEADTHKLVSITDLDYAALTTKDSNTVYCIPEL